MQKFYWGLFLTFCYLAGLAGQSIQLDRPNKREATQEALRQLVVADSTFQTGFTGFFLADATSGREVFSFRPDLYFTPASNTKLFTFLVAQQLLAASTPALVYQVRQDTLHLWGTGHPLLLHPLFEGYDSVLPWLRAQPAKQFVLHFPADEVVARYGLGWSWDDYNDGYVYERSLWPMYGNSLSVRKTGRDTVLRVLPPSVPLLKGVAEDELLTRLEQENRFMAAPRLFLRKQLNLRRPLVTSPVWATSWLAEVLQKPVTLGASPRPQPGYGSVLEAPLPDTVYQRLLDNSDNFIAEQLLLLAATSKFGKPDLAPLFTFVRDSLLPDLQLTERQWVDGSGLSRYDQFSPRQLGLLVGQLLKTVGPERLKALLANGTSSGTLSGRYMANGQPYVWAKTGSLRNVLCLSGFIETQSGRRLVFSFMHNNYPGRSSEHYAAMERALQWVYESL